MKIISILKTVDGEFEVSRVLGSAGTLVYIVFVHIFIGWDIFYGNRPFDVTAYCLAFPSGLGVAVGSIAGSVALKEKMKPKPEPERVDQ